jgi:SAM-dependent methyltransferase
MNQQPTEDELKELAYQLSNPNGDMGIKVAYNMNQTNISMTYSCINSLEISNNDIILEIGHGNCSHLKEIINKANNIKYFGLDISELMKKEAENINSDFINNNIACYSLYDGINIPFKENYFNKIMTVNTIYFWRRPVDFIKQIYYVLKKDGLFSITFAQKESMEKYPFTKYGFELYDNQKIENLIKTTNFQIYKTDTQEEFIKGKTGEMVNRVYTTFTLKK